MIAPLASCVDDSGSPLCAADVARGVTRLLLRHGLVAMGEVPLDGGRRADLMAIDAKGGIVIVEIKRSEEHTSELQSLMRISYAVFCLKKKKNINTVSRPPSESTDRQ